MNFYEALNGLLSIPSVATDGDTRYPFGKPCDDALTYTLSLCKDLGFRTKRCGNLLGYAEIGEGTELVGVLVHLDVVPEGSGWDYPCFGMTDTGDRIYGRGISDDKGPAVMCIYAMKRLLDEKVPLKRRIRIIFGLTEERGNWIDMEYYRQTEELPTFGITPDADFPALCGEKGMLLLKLTMPLDGSGVESIDGGTVHNMVPDFCKATVNGKEYTMTGKSAHGSLPEQGVNAICKLLCTLNDGKLARFVSEKFGSTTDGSLIDAALSDEKSGHLSLNFGIIGVNDGNIEMTLDIRYPVTFTGEEIAGRIAAQCQPYGVTLTVMSDTPPIYTDKSSPLIQSLMAVYREETGDTESEAIVIGGGTYAKAMQNIISFGPLFPDSPVTEHQKNEFMRKSDIEMARRIYYRALLRLGTTE